LGVECLPARAEAGIAERPGDGCFGGLSVHLHICLGAVLLLKAAILQDVGVSFAVSGIAAVKALLLAKFMVIGSAFSLGRRFRDRPLIWPTLYHALIFLVLPHKRRSASQVLLRPLPLSMTGWIRRSHQANHHST
jgi:hypothetical protein